MDNFIVSARKYRPAQFADVVGQDQVTTTLKNEVKSNKLAQSFLFCGPRGVGKTTCARILAKVINCQRPTQATEPCNECESCLSFNQSTSFNIHELDAASNNSVEDIRSLTEQVRYPPQAGKYKIYIIDEVHMLSQSAFNAFLKTLEEPPPYAIFILATTEKHKIIPTILSRCQIFDFNRISLGEIVEHLKRIAGMEGIEADPDALHVIAQKCDGALRDALSIFDRMVSFSGGKITYEKVLENLDILDYNYYFSMTEYLLSEDVAGVLKLFDQVIRAGFEGDNFINGLAEHFRDLLVSKDPETVPLLQVSDNLKDRYKSIASVTPADYIISALHICNQCDNGYKMARNKKLHVELALIRMTFIGSLLRKEPSGEVMVKAREIKKPAVKTVDRSTEPAVITPRKDPPPQVAASQMVPGTLEEVERLVGKAKDESAQKELKKAGGDADPLKIKSGWDMFASKMKEANKIGLWSIMSSITPETQGSTVVVKADNQLIESQFNEARAEIAAFLSHIAGITVSLSVIVEKKPAGEKIQRPYTAEEKFNRMAQKNPVIREMRERLDLELEF